MTSIIDSLRNDATAIFQTGITAADPYLAVKQCLSAHADSLEIALDLTDSNHKRSGNWRTIHVIAFGKAACEMAKAAQEIIPSQLIASPGIVVTNYENAKPVDNFQVLAASHPLPDQAGQNAAAIIAERVKQAKQGELILILLSGGGSALLPCPADGISLEEKITTTDLLLASGATINQVNCVRKHLSGLKGGGLARLASPADLHSLILSDVIGDDLSSIASGPTVPDDSSYTDAESILKEKQIWDKVPESIRNQIHKGVQGQRTETPKSGDPLFKSVSHTLVGSNRISLNAIRQKAHAINYESFIYSDQLTGEARESAEKLVCHCLALQAKGLKRRTAILAGGETTVTLTGTGRGGRNQEMVLAFAIAAKKHNLTGNWVFLSGGTDGLDGPTDAAGGLIDPGTLQRIDHAADLLDNNDSYHALNQSQDLLHTGATGTNVADLQVILIDPVS